MSQIRSKGILDHIEVKRDINQSPLYIFIHIPKCAGSSFGYNLKNNLDKNQFMVASYSSIGSERRTDGVLFTRPDVDTFLSRQSEGVKEALTAVFGHLCYFGMHSFFKRDCRYITFIRDPAERLYSHYLFLIRRFGNGTLLIPKLVQSLTDRHGRIRPFEEWVEYADLAKNYVTKFMKGIPEIEEISVTESDANIYVAELQKYYYIGRTEEYDIDADFLFSKIGIACGLEKRNVSKLKDVKMLKNPELLNKIAANNPLDYKLYDEALKVRELKREALNL